MLKTHFDLPETSSNDQVIKLLVRAEIIPWSKPQGPEDLSRHGPMGPEAISDGTSNPIYETNVIIGKLAMAGNNFKALHILMQRKGG